MEYELWEKTAASPFRGDPIWRMTAFRMALYLLDEAWRDTQVLRRYPMLDPASSQLYRAVGSIGANIAEGIAGAPDQTAPVSTSIPSDLLVSRRFGIMGAATLWTKRSSRRDSMS